MIVDECIIVDEQDNITGHANKAACHMFGPDQPRGQLHRWGYTVHIRHCIQASAELQQSWIWHRVTTALWTALSTAPWRCVGCAAPFEDTTLLRTSALVAVRLPFCHCTHIRHVRMRAHTQPIQFCACSTI